MTTLHGFSEGGRFDLGSEVNALILRYGKPGVLRANDVRGEALQEVRVFDFANWPEEMGDRDRRRMRKVMHSPQWVMISASGMKAAKPVTGRWYWEKDGEEFRRLKRLPVIAEVTE